MKSYCDSIVQRFLLFAVLAFLAVALFGCLDPIVSKMEAEHENLGRACQQELRQGGYASPQTTRPEMLFQAGPMDHRAGSEFRLAP